MGFSRGMLWTGAAFVAVNLLVLVVAPAGVAVEHGADSGSWLRPAQALLRHGAFVQLDDPAAAMTYRTPGYPLFAAAVMKLAGESVLAVVVAQLALLFATGLVVRAIAEAWLPGWGTTALALTVFNPNALGNAHFIQSDTLFAFFVALALWALLALAKGGLRWRHGLLVGLLGGLACLVRPSPQFLLPLFLLVFPALGLLAGEGSAWRRHALMGVGASLLAGLVVLPWVLHVGGAGQGYGLASNEVKFRYVWDHIQIVDARANGGSQWDAARRLEGEGGLVPRFAASQKDWATIDQAEQQRRLVTFGFETLLSYPLGDSLATLAKSGIQFLLAAGAGKFHALLGTETGEMARIWLSEDVSGPFDAVARFLRKAPSDAAAISLAAFAFVVGLRVLGLVGLGELVRRRQWDMALILVAMIVYFALVHLYAGNARYRLSVEPALVLLALYGLDGLRRRFAMSSVP